MENNKVWMISDSHFFHKNVIGYCKREFENVDLMNEHLINEWNKNIGKNDKVFHLGDVSFANKEKTKSVLSRLNGNKILVIGNHDRRNTVKWWTEVGFTQVYRYPIIYCEEYILSHEPVKLKDSHFKNIHGHIHGRVSEVELDKRYYNVCVDINNYQPILFEQIKTIIK